MWTQRKVLDKEKVTLASVCNARARGPVRRRVCAHVRFDSNQAWLVSANGLMKQEVIQTQAMRAERSKVVLNMRHKATHKDLHHLEKKTPMRHIYYQPI